MSLRPACTWTKGLTPEQRKIAEVELGETQEVMLESLKEFKRLIKEEEGFRPLTDDEFLLRFLRAKKYDVDRAFKTLKHYYWFKSYYSGVITHFSTADVLPFLETGKLFVSPKRNLQDGGILVAYIGSMDLSVYSVELFLAACVVAIDLGLETEASQVCGSSLVVDMEGISFSGLKSFLHPSILAIIVRAINECWPIRLHSIHFINEPSYFGLSWNLVKPLLSKKIRERVQFHRSSLKSLHKSIPAEALPENLGGQLGEKDFLEFQNMVRQNAPLIERLNTYTYDNIQYPSKRRRSSCSSCKEEVESEVTTRTLFNVTKC